MHDERDAHGLKRTPAQFRSFRRRGRGQGSAVDFGEVDPGLFEHTAVAEHARAPAAAFLALPVIIEKRRRTVYPAEFGTDRVLQAFQVVAHLWHGVSDGVFIVHGRFENGCWSEIMPSAGASRSPSDRF